MHVFNTEKMFRNRIDAYYAFEFAKLLGEFGIRWEATDEITVVDLINPGQSLHYRIFKYYVTKKQRELFSRVVKVRHIQHYFV